MKKDSSNSLNGLHRAEGALNGVNARFTPVHFPEIIVDARGTIVLCPQCKSSSVTRQQRAADSPPAVLCICNTCGSVWRPPC